MVQRRAPPFEVRRSRIHGRGVFATRRIRKGARVIEYEGRRIGRVEMLARYDNDSGDRHHTLAFEIDNDTYIDAARGGNESRFINHSCEPNCEPFLVDGERIVIHAIKNIQPSVELAYDYNLARPARLRAGWKERYACRCGAAGCRGTLLGQPRERARSIRGG
jgi:SET domain-containing protein